MSNRKTQLTQTEVLAFLNQKFAGRVVNVQQLLEGEESQAFSFECEGSLAGKKSTDHSGEESQAFSFECEGASYVFRTNRSARGFQKDSYAYSHFCSVKVPIPRVIEIGQIDEQHAYCISEKMPGFTLQDADSKTLKGLLQPVSETWLAISDTDISSTSGFGDIDVTGQGRYSSWREYLLSILDSSYYDWDSVFRHVDKGLVNDLMAAFIALIQHCPEERRLVHGDFGSNNVLTYGYNITAVLDWDNAKYGDPLFDVANAYFWRTWLECMDLQADYYEVHLSTLPHYHERILCYQLRIGLDEIYDNAIHQDSRTTAWVARRCTEILKD